MQKDKCMLCNCQGLNSTSELGKGSLMAAGGAAGAVYWLVVYPADIVKSKLQVDSFHKPAYKGTLDCARQVKDGQLSATIINNNLHTFQHMCQLCMALVLALYAVGRTHTCITHLSSCLCHLPCYIVLLIFTLQGA